MFSRVSFLLVLAQLGLTVLATTPSPLRLTTPELSKIVNKKYLQPVSSNSYDTGPALRYVELPVNHLDKNSETFLDRYWVDDYYYQPGGPVFFIDNGEDTADGMEVYLREGASGSLAEQFHGLLILWEHRFYGTSMPNITADMQFKPAQLAKYLQYHTVEQAMEDVATFARGFSFDLLPNVDLTPGATPWVFVGGSYPGARAAWMRFRNPEVFHASLASSAVVELQEDFWQYYRIIENTMPSTGYANCSSDMRALATYIDNAFDKQDATAIDSFLSGITGPKGSPLYRYFHFDDLTGANDAWSNRMTNIRAAIKVMFQDFQYVGVDGYLGFFCDGLQITAQTMAGNGAVNIQSSAGIFADYGTQPALVVYASVLQVVWENVLTPSDYPPPGATLDNSGSYNCEFDQATCQKTLTQYSWMYQVCSEIGAFQVTNSSRPSSLLPKIESVDNWLRDCVFYFGDTVANGPNIAPINKKYGGWNISMSNIFFTNGELDPWRAVSLHSVEDGSPKRESTTDIPASGKTPGGTKFFGYLVQGGFHCPDLGNVTRLNTSSLIPPDIISTQTSADTAHNLFIDALNTWLPDFKKHNITNTSTISPTDVSNGGASRNSSSTTKKSTAVSNMISSGMVLYSVLLVSSIVYTIF